MKQNRNDIRSQRDKRLELKTKPKKKKLNREIRDLQTLVLDRMKLTRTILRR